MNIRSLEAFLHVMDDGSISAAAETMNLSQPAVTRLVQILEEHLNANLFDRSRRTLVPTEQAEHLYGEAKQIVARISELPGYVSQLEEHSLIPLRIICQLRTAPGLVLPALSAFAKNMSQIGATLDIHPRLELSRRIMKSEFDIGVFVLPLPGQNLDFAMRFRVRLDVLLPKGHHLANRKALTPEDLSGETYIALRQGLMARQATDVALAAVGQSLKPKFEVSSPSAIHRMVSNGLGFAFSDLIVLEPELRELTVLVPWQPETYLDIGVYVPQRNRNDRAIDAFLAYLQAARGEVTNTAI